MTVSRPRVLAPLVLALLEGSTESPVKSPVKTTAGVVRGRATPAFKNPLEFPTRIPLAHAHVFLYIVYRLLRISPSFDSQSLF